MELGFLGDEIEKDDSVVDKVGGKPIFLSEGPPAKFSKCLNCFKPLMFVLQINGNSGEQKNMKRIFHLFVCLGIECVKSGKNWRVLRTVKKTSTMIKSFPSFSETMKETDDWNSPCFGEEAEEAVWEDIQSLLVKRDTEPKAKQKEPKRKGNELGSVESVTCHSLEWDYIIEGIKPRYLEFEKEMNVGFESKNSENSDDEEGFSSRKEDYKHEMELLKRYQEQTGDSLDFIDQDEDEEAEEKGKKKTKNKQKPSLKIERHEKKNEWDAEAYENYEPDFYNKHFKRFLAKISQEPEQCIRYHRKGEALWYNENRIDIERCANCNSKKEFEFQLMPKLLSVFPKESSKESDSHSSKQDIIASLAREFDFATVLVFSCGKNCYSEDSMTSFHEETAIVQIDNL